MARGHLINRDSAQPVLLILLGLVQLTHAQTPPKFIRTPTDQIGVQGGVASFICQATGDPQPKIVWSRKGKKVSNQRFEVIDFEDGTGSVLRVQPLRTPRDEAVYECVASNEAGEISASTRLTVLREDQLPGGFPSIDMGPQLKVVERSRTATMLCAASGNPDPEISWFKDFLPIDTSTQGRIKQLRSESFGGTPIRGALQIDRSEETDQGKYECVATNSEGTRYSTPANLYVRELRDVRRIPPRFSVPPMDYDIMPGGSVNITCQAVGVPMPYVKWMLGAEDLTPEDDMPIGKNVLELTDVRQSANYTCVAMSTLGVIETVAQITVKALPHPPGAPVIMERSATSITLMWDSGNPLPVSYYVIQYRPASSRDPFKEIDGVATTRYSVGGLSPYSHYHFRVMAVNSIGRGPPSQTVEARTAEQAPSSAPRRVRGRMLSVSTAMVHWEEPEEPNGQVVGYRVYYTAEPSLSVNQWHKEMVRGANFLTIQNLTPDKTYHIRVLAFTAVGDGPLSHDLQIIAKTGVPSQPTELKVEVKSETSVLLSWVPPAQSGSDSITGYELIYRLADNPEEQKITFEPNTSYLLKNLKPSSTYIIQLAARSKHGLGAFTSETTIQTPETLPIAPPQEVTCTSPSSTSLLVSWAAPPPGAKNDILTGYSIQYTAVELDGAKTEHIDRIPPDCFRYRMEGLRKWTLYSLTVAAHTKAGLEAQSLPVLVRTEEDVPSAPPLSVEVVAVNSSTISVTWQPPVAERRHGKIRGYQVTYIRRFSGQRMGSPNIKELLLRDSQGQNDSAVYELLISDLWPGTEYSVFVAAFTSKGDGARSKPTVVRTTPALPGVPRLTVSSPAVGAALLTWQPPPSALSPLLGYRLAYGRSDLLPTAPLTELQLQPSQSNHTVSGLRGGEAYVFRLAARTAGGYGEYAEAQLRTPEAPPTGFPPNLTAVSGNSSSVWLVWDGVPEEERNGRIIAYRVQCRAEASNGSAVAMETEVAEPTATLTELSADTAYVLRVCAVTAAGPGPYSPSVRYRTQSVEEVFAVNFRVKAAMKSSVLLTWEPKDTKSQPFAIIYGDSESVEVDGRLGQKLITKLKPQSQYSFLLTSKAQSAGGLQHRVTAMTAPNLMPSKPLILDKASSPGTVTLQLPTVQGNAKVRGYYMVVVPLKRQRGGKFLKPWEDPDEMNLDELLREINGTGRAVRVRRQVEPKAYVSAHFQNLPSEFTLGDGRVYGAFTNRQFINGQEYICFVLAILELSENTVYSTSPFSDTVVFSDVEPQPIVDEEEGLLWVVGPVLAVIFIISIVILILMYKRKRAELEGRKCSFPSSGKAMSSQHPTDPVELRRINFPTPGMASHPPISISELASHIERLKANENLRFSQEYESVDPGQQFTWEQSNLEVNKPKNRYANVIAYDHSRVLLSNIDGVPGSDYINANFIDGFRRQSAYIATQGPLPETFNDFWRMIWEQHTANIIMMTKLEEKSRNKCDQYWPSRGTEMYGQIQVSLLDTVELATYCVRTFALYKNGSSEKREVRQFQFTAWPDHGVPEHPTPFLAFLRRVKACNPPDAGPIVVHCSAGVGRTGCFIVIDAMVERVKQEKTVDIYGHVTLMRAQRNYMVQTEEQYIFIYDAILEAVTCGNTEVPARNLFSYIQRLSQTEPPENISGMEQEFKRLANAKAHTSRFVSANLPCNKFKNRLVNIMPYETTRVRLQPIRGVEGSDYINASFIDGYRQQRAYIATQGPLTETAEDYWRMLWEHNSTIVVMLTKLREMGREKCHQYWPLERSARYQYFVVDPMAEYNMPQYILREFKVTDARDGQSRTVRQFQFTDWPEQGVPKSGEGFIDFIGQVHKTKEQFGQDGPITVHCSAGVGRTGVFITLSIVLERMRYEGVVDIFQTVKMLRTQRPAMVQTEEQYQFCYRAALEYLGSFDHYAT
ncbi:protein tyrosine phosphatase receptor type Db [Chanos chanos]|uniref:protein-tyrosine-phosphatase n=1 Tax=Chanos chanos TaxID=29144 RepID=A0A6J2WGS4_CHACN|nr:receptor-type tyrosine-protein phosphatase delta-like [Chanos chanos]